MPINFDLPPLLHHDDEATYTARQLEPTIARLRAAVEGDLGEGTASPQALAAAWTRIAELRLPRKAVPAAVLGEIEELVVAWDSHGMGGIVRHAWTLTPDEIEREAGRIRRMLADAEAAAAGAPPGPVFLTE